MSVLNKLEEVRAQALEEALADGASEQLQLGLLKLVKSLDASRKALVGLYGHQKQEVLPTPPKTVEVKKPDPVLSTKSKLDF